MKNTNLSLYTAAQTRELDRLAIEQEGIAGYTLMKRAAATTFHHMMSKWPNCRRVIVLCGIGNNGGDGYLIAQMAQTLGLQVDVYQLGDLAKQKGDALTARNEMQASGLSLRQYESDTVLEADVIVDALLGTGLERNVEGLWLSAIQAINLSPANVVSVDIASGLHADTGRQLGESVLTDLTVTYIGRKQGLFTGDGKTCSGHVVFDDLDIPSTLYDQVISDVELLPKKLSSLLLKPRTANSHKGQHGHVLIVGGAPGMNGAVMMAASAALRCGCGLVSVATHPSHAAIINLQQPEIMSHGVQTADELSNLIDTADVIVLGPGLGQSTWANELFRCVLQTDKPLILDADGLNLLANYFTEKKSDSNFIKTRTKTKNWILTPHPGEAGRLLSCSATEVQNNRFQSIKKLQEKYSGICILKGAGTLLYAGEKIEICPAGNPGMASAGMGDVLSGVLGSLIAQATQQSLDLFDTASFAVCLHACAGDADAQAHGEKGLLATDLLPHLRSLVNGV